MSNPLPGISGHSFNELFEDPSNNSEFPRPKYIGLNQHIAGFQVFGFDVLPMTYINPRSAHLDDDITRFTCVDLNSIYLQLKCIGD